MEVTKNEKTLGWIGLIALGLFSGWVSINILWFIPFWFGAFVYSVACLVVAYFYNKIPIKKEE